MRLDDVMVGKADFRVVIDEIAGEADRLIAVLRRHNGATVDLTQPAPHRTRRRRSKVGRRSRSAEHAAATTFAATPKNRRPRRTKKAPHQRFDDRKQGGCPEPKRPTSGRPTPPTTAWSLSRSGLPRTNGPPYRPAMTKISTSAVASLISTRGARGVSHEEFAGPHARNPLARIFLCDVQQLASGQSRMASMAMPSHFGHLTPLAKLRQPSRNRSAHHAGLPRAPRSKAHGRTTRPLPGIGSRGYGGNFRPRGDSE